MLKIKFDSTTTVKDRGADHILREIDRIGRGVYVTTGIHQPEGSQLPRWRGEVDGKTAIATYANMQEYGTRHIPARPFMRKTIEHNTRLFLKNTAVGMRKIYNGHGSVLGLLIQNAKKQDMWMKRMIVQLKKPPNSPSTLRRKRRRGRGSNPLIDSRSMHDAVSSHINYPGKKPFFGGLRKSLARAEQKLRRVKL
jgi:HK97 gp10 family phage protein